MLPGGFMHYELPLKKASEELKNSSMQEDANATRSFGVFDLLITFS
jgi:hypothetical protein